MSAVMLSKSDGALATPGAMTRIAVLDGVRALSILLVLAGHMLPLGQKSLQLNYAAAVGGMSLFFILSGFLITSFLLSHQDIWEFLAKRVARIVPAVYVYLIFAFIIIDFQPQSFLATALFYVNYDHGQVSTFNTHLWSLCVEMQFYVIAALLVAFIGKRGLLALPVLGLAVTALRIGEGVEVSLLTHLRVDEILAGCTLALFYSGYIKGWEKVARWLRKGFWPLLVIWGLSCLNQMDALQYLRPYTAMALVASTLLRGEGLVKSFLESRPMRYIATVSYALYIWHLASLQFGLNDGSTFERYVLKRPVSFMATFAAAHLSTYYVELPISRSVRTMLKSRRAGREEYSPPQ